MIAFLIVAAVAAVFVAVVLSRPAAFRVSRSVAIAAPPAEVFAHVDDLRKWEAWNPWQRLDPGVRNTYAGPASGVGSSCAWTSRKVGTGRSTIVESRPAESIRFRLDMEKPVRAGNDAEFAFRPEGAGTVVTWTMSGRNEGFVRKAFSLVMDCEKMCGPQFEKGLENLRSVVEAGK